MSDIDQLSCCKQLRKEKPADIQIHQVHLIELNIRVVHLGENISILYVGHNYLISKILYAASVNNGRNAFIKIIAKMTYLFLQYCDTTSQK